MLKMLLPVDGSEISSWAVAAFIQRLDWYKEKPEIHLLNVRVPLHGDIAMFISKEEIGKYYQEEGLKDLKQACELLDQANIAY
jgi:hypothetical protein